MIEVPKPRGNTPFDIFEHKRMMATAQVNAASMMQELVTTLQECDIALQEWRDLVASGNSDADERALAAEVLRERRTVIKAIDNLAEVMTTIFGLEA